MQKLNYDDKVEKLKEIKLPRWHDLPDFDIYMDQVVNYINLHLDILNFSDDDRSITPSMVNNYVKNSIVKAPIKKHYKKYHLAYLIVVMILKRVYSLSDISKMIEIQTKMEESNLELAYDTFGLYFEKCLHCVITNGNLESLDIDVQNEYQSLLLNVVESVALKIYAEIKLCQN